MRLSFKSPVHFGEAGVGLEHTAATVHSDTLFSAIANAWADLHGSDDLAAVLADCDRGAPPWLLSSAFPWYTADSGYHYLLPKPALPPPGFESPERRAAYAKTVKATAYVPLSAFVAWLRNQPVDYEAVHAARVAWHGRHRRYLAPRLAIDRVTAAPDLYFCGLVAYERTAGLYFIARVRDAAVQQKLQQAVALLGEAGLGGERSTGCGRFQAEWERIDGQSDWADLDLTPSGQVCLLSLLYPTPTERAGLLDGASYELLERRGWAWSRRMPAEGARAVVRMLTEGSVLPRPVHGALATVTPPTWRGAGHPVRRSGLALAVWAKEGGHG